ncbi:hypothetical protein, partial [Streptomyces sp. P9-1]|uniref:hypothetical protein n=1 Tax=Streptomyces sp. P9-1 TaxID=3422589 RepID=UPI003D36FEAA
MKSVISSGLKVPGFTILARLHNAGPLPCRTKMTMVNIHFTKNENRLVECPVKQAASPFNSTTVSAPRHSCIITASLRFGLSITGAGSTTAQAVVPLRVLQAGKPVVPVAVLNAQAAALARPAAKLAAATAVQGD